MALNMEPGTARHLSFAGRLQLIGSVGTDDAGSDGWFT